VFGVAAALVPDADVDAAEAMTTGEDDNEVETTTAGPDMICDEVFVDTELSELDVEAEIAIAVEPLDVDKGATPVSAVLEFTTGTLEAGLVLVTIGALELLLDDPDVAVVNAPALGLEAATRDAVTTSTVELRVAMVELLKVMGVSNTTVELKMAMVEVPEMIGVSNTTVELT